MDIIDYEVEAKKYILPYLRANISVMAEAIGGAYNNLQTVLVYLTDILNIDKARGIWLDYIGTEVGALRDEADYGDYFCVNREHVNVSKMFYFYTSKADPLTPLCLSDAEFIQKIYAYIGANQSCGTHDEVIQIIQNITNADDVIVEKTSDATVTIHLYGGSLVLTKNTITYIKQILGDGIYLEEITQND